ncbi:DUF4156 domain-containing protein [Kangiella sp. HZ709]|uniref:DUF4156 domain-containing protein n=1 Tax=Kangiella sp. HZ709 TaxID=2666328 RepID=UPI0012B0CEB9|nr:DUF4156 domain-containing protein [Kangiella sp. HZ709]MRX28631.1 DUF4156 domain-containing protein [Kangiella sp. HZ709]
MQTKTLLTLFTAFILSACVGKSIQVEAAKITLLNNEPSNCKFLGEVYGTQGNIVTGLFTTDEELIAGARNDIRNNALALGANALLITRTNPNRTERLDFYSFYGKAYQCL